MSPLNKETEEEFENYLHEFQMRMPAPLVDEVRLKSRKRLIQWAGWAAAALFVMAAVLVTMKLAGKQDVEAMPYAAVAQSGSNSNFHSGEKIEVGRIVRPNSGGLVLLLNDGSKVEVRSQTELSLESAPPGMSIRLHQGSIIVNPAPGRRLQVKTSHALISADAVSLINDESYGTVVAAFQGHVFAEFDGKRSQVAAGEQIATAPSIPLLPIAEEAAWSEYHAMYVAMLPQAAVQSQAAAQPQLPPLPPDVPPVRVSPLDSDDPVERACGTCHLASVARSIVSTTGIQELRQQIADLKARLEVESPNSTPGRIQNMEDEIKKLEYDLSGRKSSLSTYVLNHFDVGNGISNTERSKLVDALVESHYSAKTNLNTK